MSAPHAFAGAEPVPAGAGSAGALWWVVALVLATALIGARTASPAPVVLERFESGVAAGRAQAAATAPGRPVELAIPDLAVRSTVRAVGIARDGSLETPPAHETGWYAPGAVPGTRGSAVVAGHVDSRTAPGVFAELPRVPVGALVGVRDEAGVWTVFRVEAVTRHPKERLPRAIWGPSPRRLLRLVTCGGAFDTRTGHYRDNVVAHATALGRWRPPAHAPSTPPPWDRLRDLVARG